MRKSTRLSTARFVALAFLSLMTTAGLVSIRNTKSSAQEPTGACTLAGTWTQQSEGLGPSNWTITADGEATESGLGNAKGKATLSGGKLRIEWNIPGYNNSGYYEWTLDASCKGSGVAVNTVSGITRNTTVAKTAGPPENVAAISAELSDVPAEVWVGWGRDPMAVSFCITGFISNSPEPLKVDCLDVDNSFGDHFDASGDRLKTVRIVHCGETAAPSNWAGHTCSRGPGYHPEPGYLWGIFISAPARDLENDVQPGRPRDICIGTNPVRLRISQKGAGETFVTLSPQLVLKAGLVGGGGTYAASNCNGDSRGTGGGGAGGGTGPLRCGLGSTWRESESGWIGTWTRRGTSNTFDGHWERSGWRPIDQLLSVNFSGNTVSIFRQGQPGNTCVYSGTVAMDGITVSGEYSCNDNGNRIGPAPWTATINCGGGGGGAGGNLTGPIAIQTVNGNFLTAVRGGGIQGPGAINSDATRPSGWETFEFEQLSDGKYAIKTVNGNYLTAMRGGGLTGTDVIHTDGRRIDAWEKFSIEQQSDGTYAIRTANGNYLTAVNGGGIGGGRGAIHSNATTVGGWEKFKLVGTTQSSTPEFKGEVDTDRKGQDYKVLELPQAIPKICNDACAADPNCKAWTYLKPNIYGPNAYCYLKSGVPPPTPNTCCVSGARGSLSAFGPMQYGQDIADAGDYKALDLPEPRPELCEAECARDGRCRSYSYVKPGTYDYPRPRCWLKEKPGRFVPNANAISAIKNAGQ